MSAAPRAIALCLAAASSAALALAAPAGARAADSLYVSPSGSDANPCSSAAPCRQLARADELATPGATINVAPGSYAGATLTTPGSAAARVRYVSMSRWAAKVVGWVTAGDYVDVEGFDMTVAPGSGDNAILTLQGDHARAIGNYVHDLDVGCLEDIGGAGINAAGQDYETRGQEIIGNVVLDIGAGPRDGNCRLVHGISAGQPEVRIVNNVVARSLGDGITSWHGATGLTVVNNTSADNGGIGITIGTGDGGATASGHRRSYVANNIVTGNALAPIGERGGSSVVGDNHYANNQLWRNYLTYHGGPHAAWETVNRYDGNGSTETETIGMDPLYVDAAADDYRLRAESAAVDSGTAGHVPAIDMLGTLRPQGLGVDRGAFER